MHQSSLQSCSSALLGKAPLLAQVRRNRHPRPVGGRESGCVGGRRCCASGPRGAREAIGEKEAELEGLDVEEAAAGGGAAEEGAKGHKRNGSRIALGGLKVSPELFAIAMVYFVQGTTSLSSLATQYFLKDTLMQNPAQVAMLQSYGKLPWLAKPLYGFASDSIPILGYRQKSYIALFGLLSSFSWWVLSGSVNGPVGAVACIITSSMGIAVCDVVVDSVVVMRSRGAPKSTMGSLQSLCWASAAAGGVVCSFLSGYLLENLGPRGVFSIVAVFPLIVCLSSFFVREQPIKKTDLEDTGQGSSLIHPARLSSRFLYQAKALWNAFSDKQILLPAAFLFIWMATPSSSSAMFFFYTEELHFTPEFMGRITFVGELASLGGVGLFNFYLKDIPLRKLFRWTCIIGTLLGLTQLLLVTGANRSLGLSDQLFVIGDSIVLDVIGKVSFMPVLVLAASLCPDGVEASLFALLMSILNAGSFTGQALGGRLTEVLGVTSSDFTNLPLLVSICVVSTLLPIPFLRLLPTNDRND